MSDLRKELDHQLSGLAWSLWKELGVAGIYRFHEGCLIQPEELIILTTLVSEHDPRLRDEALDWCSRYHAGISVSRLRALLKEMSSDMLIDFSRFVSALNSISSAKWPGGEEKPLFKVQISEKSLLPSLAFPSLLVLRLRSLWGPGVKSDVLAYLLTKNERYFSAADLMEIGYSKRSLLTALDQLAASGVVAAVNVGNKKSYELKRQKELQVAIGKLPKIAPPWNKILKVIMAIRSVIPEIQKSSGATRNVIFRNCLARIESFLPIFISPLLYGKPDFEKDWKAMMETFNAFRQGNFFMQYEVHDEFDKIVLELLPKLHQLDDCVDGIEMIYSKIELEHQRHGEIYKECYQLFLSFARDLAVSLKGFLQFPFHKIMDEPLADIPYQFSNEKALQFLDKIAAIKPLDKITSAQLAQREYQMFMSEIDVLRQFLYSFRKRLEDLYFVKTDIHLLSHSLDLYKRQLVLELFPTATN